MIELTSDERPPTPKLKSLGASYTSTTTPAQMTLTAAKTLLVVRRLDDLTGKLFSDPTPLVADDGNATPLAGQTVTIKARAATAGYTDVGTVTTAADGTFPFAGQADGGDELPRGVGRRDDRHRRLPAGLGGPVDVKAKVS